MQPFPPTYIIRHQRENLKKCSLRTLERFPDLLFLTYPVSNLPDLSAYILLAMDGPPLTAADSSYGLLLLDATWRYAERMNRFVESEWPIKKRSIPEGFQTAYPRRQDDCPDPEKGLASIEALYIAFRITGRNCAGLLDNYYWKNAFLEKNQKALSILTDP
jgi:pre-rRNA-processing protein TSR3